MCNALTLAIYDRAALTAAIAQGWRPEFLFFWGHTARSSGIGKHVLSQWWPAAFSLGGVSYASAEHFMMAEKARLFDDATTRDAVLAASKPGAAKALGRTVAGFDGRRWMEHRFDIVVRASLAKFGQNADLRGYLLETGNKVLVEASPVDRVWGIGLAADDARAQVPAEWKGLNLLGFALMRARATLADASAR
jgi:ribA/ribD-fused uncharacterized protein